MNPSTLFGATLLEYVFAILSKPPYLFFLSALNLLMSITSKKKRDLNFKIQSNILAGVFGGRNRRGSMRSEEGNLHMK